jgi:hypothetical protein
MPKHIDIEKLTQRKVTMPIIFIVALVVFGFRADNLTIGYLSEFFMERAVAEEQFKQIQISVKANATLISGHIRTYELNENAKESSRVEAEIFNLNLYVSANGANQITNDRLRGLNAETSRLKRVRACIVRNKLDENCGDIR